MGNHLKLPELLKTLDRSKKIVLVHGVFDILHKGHIILFSEAKKLGDILVVGVDCDKNVKYLKGKNRPVNPLSARIFVLTHILDIDYVFTIPDFSNNKDISLFYQKLYKKISPNVVATNLEIGNYGKHKQEQAKILGAKFVNIREVYYPRPSKLMGI